MTSIHCKARGNMCSQATLLKAVKAKLITDVMCCPGCLGTGLYRMMIDEHDFGQPWDTNTRECPECADARNLLSQFPETLCKWTE